MPPSPTRDIRLDAWRALAMIYIVCVIHVAYWTTPLPEPVQSLLLFEMPCIFFIAGAAQSLKAHGPAPLLSHVAGRARRVLLPYYIFLPLLLAVLAALTPLGLTINGQCVDIGQLTPADVAKTLATGGCGSIPFYGYTWFISAYLLVLCSFPLQVKALRWVPRWAWMALHVVVVAALSAVSLGGVDYEVKNVPTYSFFFMMGYLYYRRCPRRVLWCVGAVAVALSAAAFATGVAMPMQGHKFPPDIIFLCYGTAAICLLALTIGRWPACCPRWLMLWNTRGYHIYLYQVFGAYAVALATEPWIGHIGSTAARFAILAALTFVANACLSAVTYPLEQRVISLLSRKKKGTL